MKYKVEVGSHVTRFVARNITVNAKNIEEAGQKAIDKYIDIELSLASSVDAGEPRIDFVEQVN